MNSRPKHGGWRALGVILVGLALPIPVSAQGIPPERPPARPPSALVGWADWEKGEALLKRIQVPPAPIRTPEEEQATFRVDPAYRVELVASEPMIRNPIFFEFDPQGRIWVIEYPGYMRDLAGTGEGDPLCRVVVLEDTDGDGRADRSTVFLDQLVMPRSLAFVKGGVLVLEPPRVWFCEDVDGDLRCDRKRQVGTMGVAGNPQHSANGLRPGIDNWLHNADWPKRCQWRDGALVEADTVHRGQFGVTFDETGRFYTCYENKALHGDHIPAEYVVRNRQQMALAGNGGIPGVNQDLARNAQEVFPIRVTPGVTLGALELRDDGRLRTYTIASGACYYDGHQFPPDARHNVFVPDSAGHLVGRLVLGDGITPEARRFYPAEREFLASTDERFRPVNARVGPDGALYVADLYHGIIEHVIFMVPWLSRQITERKLDSGNDLGRLWRMVAKDRPIDRGSPNLGSASGTQLIQSLGHSNGWHRLTAQRLLVERGGPAEVAALKDKVTSTDPLGALHALWTLEGLEALDTGVLRAGLVHPDDRVRAAAVRLTERVPDAVPLETLRGLLSDPSPRVRLQLALTLGEHREPGSLPLLAEVLSRDDRPVFQTAVVSGLEGRELEFLAAWLGRPESSAGNPEILTLLARCVLDEGQPGRISDLFRLLLLIPEGRSVQRKSLLDALVAYDPAQPLSLEQEPRGLTTLLSDPDPEIRETAARARARFTWPGDPNPPQVHPEPPPLPPGEAARVRSGEQLYGTYCAPCHQPHGGGNAGVAPPLAQSEWVSGPPERLARIVLHGLYGPISVRGQIWNLNMPALGAAGTLDDENIARILSFIRTAWGNRADPVPAETVARARAADAQRSFPWRAGELLGVGAPPPAADRGIPPGPGGEIVLPARAAILHGQLLVYSPSLDCIGRWSRRDEAAEWNVEIPAPGSYDVLVMLAADTRSEGNRFVVQSESGSVRGQIQTTGSFENFKEVAAGRLHFNPGSQRVLLHPEGDLKGNLAEIRGLRLIPAPSPRP